MGKNSKQVKRVRPMPMVSICTPTFNRRPFIPFMIKCFEHQNYPKDRMEWIIIDDGTDKIEDLVKNVPQVKYFKFDTKMTLGKKRNFMHSKSQGKYIIYMDDDDYYPPERVSHAVDILEKNPKALCAGSSEMHIYFKHNKKLYQFGPYGPNHATAATFAFRKEMLTRTSYEETASCAEEKHFLKEYTIPFVQLDTTKTILVISHIHNSVDKKTLLEGPPNPFVKESAKTIDDFIKEPHMKKFYLEDVDKMLEDYDPGKPENKPDVLKQMEEMKKKREEMMVKQQQQQQQQQTTIQEVIQNFEKKIAEQNVTIQELLKENQNLKSKHEYLDNKITAMIKKQIKENQEKKLMENGKTTPIIIDKPETTIVTTDYM